MDAKTLASSVASLRPDYSPAEQLRFAFLVALQADSFEQLHDELELERQLTHVTGKLSASTDQHAAVSSELDSLASTEPCEFNPDHLWTLVRALKVQSQMLNLYLG